MNGDHHTPLVRIGQGPGCREIYPEDVAASPPRESIDLRFLIVEPAEVYHARSREYLTAHALADFRRCPRLYRKRQLGLIPESDSPFYLVGRAAHTLILEGRDRYGREYAVGGPTNPRTGQPFGPATKAFAEWAARQGKPVLSDDQAAIVEQMAAAVHEHALARELLALDAAARPRPARESPRPAGLAEGVVRCRYEGIACQARIDWISTDPAAGIVDLKTTDSIEHFEAAVEAFGYLHQLAFYRALVAQVSGYLLPVHLIAVEKREPYRCGVWRVAPAALDAVGELNLADIRQLIACRQSDCWPTGYEALRAIERS